jgi:predicted dehydrogenase
MEIYGDSGYIITKNNRDYITRTAGKNEERRLITENDIHVYTDPFSYFVEVIRGKIKIESFGLYSLENNIMVVQILEAARESAKKGKTIYLNKSGGY